MYFFYLNFPTYKERTILIHKKECGFCKNEIGNTNNGFWAGPFQNLYEIESSLKKLNNLMIIKFQFKNCSCCD
jgi:hypothetical protein